MILALTPIWVATRGIADMVFNVYAFSLGGTEKKLRSFPTFDELINMTYRFLDAHPNLKVWLAHMFLMVLCTLYLKGKERAL